MNERKQREIRLATDIIAKLLASENLKIIDGGTNVSYIDVVKREVHVVKFKSDSPLNTESVRLTSLAHEVGHALFTPVDLLHQKIDESYPNLAPFINIVEDVRIERLIKNRFAGLHRIMNEGRLLMYKNGVFGEDAITNPNSLEFINKFILAFKVGISNTNGLILSNVESCVLRYIELHATDKESVIKCAKLLYNLCEYKALPPDELDKFNESINPEKNNSENESESSESCNNSDENISLNETEENNVNFDNDNFNNEENSDESPKEDNNLDEIDNTENTENTDSSNSNEDSNSKENEVEEGNELDPNTILRVLLSISEKLTDDDVNYKKEYDNNILQKLDNELQNHVDNNSRTATISKTFFSNNIIQMYEV